MGPLLLIGNFLSCCITESMAASIDGVHSFGNIADPEAAGSRDVGQGPGRMLTGSGRGCSGHDVNGGNGGNDGNGGSGGRVAKCLQPGVWAPVWPWAAANMGLSCLLSGHRHPQLSGSRTRGQTTDYFGTSFHSVYIIHTSSCGTRTRSKLDTTRHSPHSPGCHH